jgi:SPP1 gp7 family putative phage head morphogenesis protein
VDVFTAEPWLRDELRSWARESGALITTLEDDAIRQVETWAQRGVREGQRHTEIAKKIEERLGVSRRRARLIARDQTKKLNGRLTEERQRKAGVSMYIWRTSRDERVRGNPSGKYPDSKPSHHALDGKYCRWDDPTVYADSPEGPWKSRASIGAVEEHPGQPINDRCTAEPVLNSLLEALK